MNLTPATIKASRVKAGLTQAQAAERVGYSTRAWVKWESGERRMHDSTWLLWRVVTAPPECWSTPIAEQLAQIERRITKGRRTRPSAPHLPG